MSQAAENDLDLLERFRRGGDAAGFTELAQRYGGMVYSACLRVTGDAHSAADAAQEAFFELVKNGDRVRGSVGGWLHAVATRRAVDLLRRDRTRRKREREYAERPRDAGEIAWSEVSPHVDEALAELPEEAREVLIRHFLQGRTMVQLASEAGVSQPTISRRVEQALALLREKLRGRGVTVGAAALGAMLVREGAQAAPASVMAELGKMAAAGAAGGAGTGAADGMVWLASWKTAAAVALVIGGAALLSYEVSRFAGSSYPAPPAPPAGRAGRPGMVVAGRPAMVMAGTRPATTRSATTRSATGPAVP